MQVFIEPMCFAPGTGNTMVPALTEFTVLWMKKRMDEEKKMDELGMSSEYQQTASQPFFCSLLITNFFHWLEILVYHSPNDNYKNVEEIVSCSSFYSYQPRELYKVLCSVVSIQKMIVFPHKRQNAL